MKLSVAAPALDRPASNQAGLLDPAMRAADSAERHTFVSDLGELVKLRLSMLVVATTLAGFYAGWQGPLDVALLLHALVGTAFAAAGASALNQVWEREYDALMRRTRDRPIPAGRMSVETALLLGCGFSLVGLLYLAVFTNLLAAVLAAITVAIYIFAYTPLKRKTTLNTLVGAVPGAIPPMIGWAVATGGINYGAWLLFALMFLWQMPHFLAIAWMYRDDYAQAGYVMLPGRDPSGFATGRQCINYSFITWIVGLLPTVVGLTSVGYFISAFVLGFFFTVAAVRFQIDPSRQRARQLFLASIIYLPLILACLAIFKSR
jgi:protoheme IX farnesyltransferase